MGYESKDEVEKLNGLTDAEIGRIVEPGVKEAAEIIQTVINDTGAIAIDIVSFNAGVRTVERALLKSIERIAGMTMTDFHRRRLLIVPEALLASMPDLMISAAEVGAFKAREPKEPPEKPKKAPQIRQD